jgi:hypothetical protein
MRRKEERYIRQSAELLDLQKNILRIGFDSSTDFHAVFKHTFRKKFSCTIHGEERKTLTRNAKKYRDSRKHLPIARLPGVIFLVPKIARRTLVNSHEPHPTRANTMEPFVPALSAGSGAAISVEPLAGWN